MQEVEAVKSAGQLAQLKAHLSERGAIYLDVWKFGVNTTLRITDLLSIPVDDVRALDAEHPVLAIRETKTGKQRTITLDRGALAVVKRRLERHAADTWLFQSTSARHSRRDPPKPVTRRVVGRVFAAAGETIRQRAQLGTHSMRKTHGYAMHAAGVRIERIARMFGHSHPAITRRYIGLDTATVRWGVQGVRAVNSPSRFAALDLPRRFSCISVSQICMMKPT